VCHPRLIVLWSHSLIPLLTNTCLPPDTAHVRFVLAFAETNRNVKRHLATYFLLVLPLQEKLVERTINCHKHAPAILITLLPTCNPFLQLAFYPLWVVHACLENLLLVRCAGVWRGKLARTRWGKVLIEKKVRQYWRRFLSANLRALASF